ncbi:MAG TPA: type II CAAX endopeptidase family protein [Planctomycetota bacterium]|nr:type II CAAX endopeptidase family protein [Planctomycetota bacterium]
MSIAEPYSAAAQRRFQAGMIMAILALNVTLLVLLVLASTHLLRDPSVPPPPPEKAMAEQIEQLRGISRKDSVLYRYAGYLEELSHHQNDTPDQLEAFNETYMTSLPASFWLKMLAICALFGGLILLSLGLAVWGLLRLLRGPPLKRRWQRWQRGVVSPLPIWMLIAGCFLIVATLLVVRSVVDLSGSIFLQLTTWEIAQATLVGCLILAARSSTGLHPWRDFGFFRRPISSIRAGLKYYFAMLPIFWILAIAGALLFGLVDAAAGSPKDLDESGRLTLEKIIQPQNDPWGPLALFLAAVVLAPLLEELFFRGFLYGGLRRWMSAPAAMVLSAAVFAAMHPMQNHLPIFFLGMFLAYTYEKTGNLGASMAVHFTHNLIVTLVMGLAFL